MAVNIPVGFQQVMPYLIVNGALGLQEFMQEVFGAVEKARHMSDEQTVMHAQVVIGESIIMFSDAKGAWQPITAGLFIYVENADETYRKALDAGAVSLMEPADQEYGRACGVTDPFGNTWWITGVPSAT